MIVIKLAALLRVFLYFKPTVINTCTVLKHCNNTSFDNLKKNTTSYFVQSFYLIKKLHKQQSTHLAVWKFCRVGYFLVETPPAAEKC